MKKVPFLLLTFLIFGCTNSLNWQQSEEYSLLQVKESIENNDLYLFEKHFDIERVSKKLCDEIINYTKEQIVMDYKNHKNRFKNPVQLKKRLCENERLLFIYF